MSFNELLQEVKRIRAEQIRYEFTNYFECVTGVEFIRELCQVLEGRFGPPLKRAGQDPTKEAKRCAESLGGIQKNQVLYFLEKEDLLNCAMLWPWEDGTRVTVKIAQFKP